jgi:hypothetical protein
MGATMLHLYQEMIFRKEEAAISNLCLRPAETTPAVTSDRLLGIARDLKDSHHKNASVCTELTYVFTSTCSDFCQSCVHTYMLIFVPQRCPTPSGPPGYLASQHQRRNVGNRVSGTRAYLDSPHRRVIGG